MYGNTVRVSVYATDLQLNIDTEFSAAPCRLAEVERTNFSKTDEP
jgi:hypothetical protein